MGFSRQEYWSGLPCPPPGDLPDPGIEPLSPAAPALQVVFTAEPLVKTVIGLDTYFFLTEHFSYKCEYR